jgi:hypothetical protein
MKAVLAAIISTVTLMAASALHAEQFRWSKGYWNKEGAFWIEYPTYAPGKHFTFSELTRDSTFVVLFDPTREFIFRLPLAGGFSSWIIPQNNSWTNFVVTHVP